MLPHRVPVSQSDNRLSSTTFTSIWTLLFVTSMILLPPTGGIDTRQAASDSLNDIHEDVEKTQHVETDLSHNDSQHSLKSFFPHGLARNSIHNLPPLEEEWNLLDQYKPSVENLMNEWKELPLPKHFDWRKKEALTPVKDQKYCAAPYAFAVVAQLEAQFKIRHGELIPFSVQQVIDCDIPNMALNFGCKGGYATRTFYYIQSTAGLETEKDYPWEGRRGVCRYERVKTELQIKSMLVLSGENRIKRFISHLGPVIAHINPALMINDYNGEIIRSNEDKCSTNRSRLTHMVLIVGFGRSKSGIPYWIVRNSWGPRWGYGGYFYIERGQNACGIEDLVFFNLIE